jgi:DNA invertase Pin-like site-specific DNA recombinase
MSNPRRARRGRKTIEWPENGLIIAAILARVSLDKDGKGKSTESQVSESRETCAEFYWTVDPADIYVDNSISASEFTEKERPEWERLRAAVRSGRLHVVIAWEVSRLSRSQREGLDFMADCKRVGTKIHIVAEERTFDLAKHADWKALRNLFADAEDESHKLSDRLNRGQRVDRGKGRQNGRCPYGYTRRYDEHTREPIQEIHAQEAEVVREIFERLANGEALSSVTLSLNKRDVPPPTRPGRHGTDEQGRPLKAVRGTDGRLTGKLVPVSKYGMWTHPTVRGIATNPVYIGKITSAPSYGTWNRDLSDLIDAPQYPRILNDDAVFFAAVKNVLRVRPSSPGSNFGGAGRPGAARHLLTHLAVCGACGGVITPGNRVYQAAVQPGASSPGANAVKGRKGFQPLPAGTVREAKVTRYYRCARVMHVNVQEPAADEYVGALVIDKLCELADVGGFTGYESERLIAARSEEAKLTSDLAEAVEQFSLGRISATTLGTIESRMRPRIAELQQRQRLLSVPASLHPFMASRGDPELIAKTWHGLTLEGKRSVLRELAEAVRLYPAKHAGRGQGHVSERIEVSWNPIYVVSGDAAVAGEGASVAEG